MGGLTSKQKVKASCDGTSNSNVDFESNSLKNDPDSSVLQEKVKSEQVNSCEDSEGHGPSPSPNQSGCAKANCSQSPGVQSTISLADGSTKSSQMRYYNSWKIPNQFVDNSTHQLPNQSTVQQDKLPWMSFQDQPRYDYALRYLRNPRVSHLMNDLDSDLNDPMVMSKVDSLRQYSLYATTPRRGLSDTGVQYPQVIVGTENTHNRLGSPLVSSSNMTHFFDPSSPNGSDVHLLMPKQLALPYYAETPFYNCEQDHTSPVVTHVPIPVSRKSPRSVPYPFGGLITPRVGSDSIVSNQMQPKQPRGRRCGANRNFRNVDRNNVNINNRNDHVPSVLKLLNTLAEVSTYRS